MADWPLASPAGKVQWLWSSENGKGDALPMEFFNGRAKGKYFSDGRFDPESGFKAMRRSRHVKGFVGSRDGLSAQIKVPEKPLHREQTKTLMPSIAFVNLSAAKV